MSDNSSLLLNKISNDINLLQRLHQIFLTNAEATASSNTVTEDEIEKKTFEIHLEIQKNSNVLSVQEFNELTTTFKRIQKEFIDGMMKIEYNKHTTRL